ncbi:uncharacterized protein J3R85_012450 [Psidium guajava]|nr:uncharacterized protein J3R85_012450 [Psidium guajava]
MNSGIIFKRIKGTLEPSVSLDSSQRTYTSEGMIMKICGFTVVRSLFMIRDLYLFALHSCLLFCCHVSSNFPVIVLTTAQCSSSAQLVLLTSCNENFLGTIDAKQCSLGNFWRVTLALSFACYAIHLVDYQL